MDILNLFRQPVARIILNEDLNLLSKYCLDIKKQQKSKKIVSNVGGFQSEDIKLNSPEIKNLCNSIVLHSNIFFKNVLEIKKDIFLSNIWININEYKDYNLIHDHPFSRISGVFYVKTPKDCGNIVFMNDSNITHYITDKIINYNSYNTSTWFLPSIENTLYLFPSWLKHYVEPNLSKKSRMSMSFNLN
jgi:uncharacterized protein (TIGR02466 family)